MGTNRLKSRYWKFTELVFSTTVKNVLCRIKLKFLYMQSSDLWNPLIVEQRLCKSFLTSCNYRKGVTKHFYQIQNKQKIHNYGEEIAPLPQGEMKLIPRRLFLFSFLVHLSVALFLLTNNKSSYQRKCLTSPCKDIFDSTPRNLAVL